MPWQVLQYSSLACRSPCENAKALVTAVTRTVATIAGLNDNWKNESFMSSPPFKAARISNLTETFKLQMAQYMSRASHFYLCLLNDMNKSFHTRTLYQEAATYC